MAHIILWDSGVPQFILEVPCFNLMSFGLRVLEIQTLHISVDSYHFTLPSSGLRGLRHRPFHISEDSYHFTLPNSGIQGLRLWLFHILEDSYHFTLPRYILSIHNVFLCSSISFLHILHLLCNFLLRLQLIDAS